MRDLIISKINNSEKKRISYAEYMSFVLYDSQYGYYMKSNKKLGPDGDFYTSSGVHCVFGQVFAKLFLDLIEKEDLPPVVCEFGGGDGKFAEAVIEEWNKLSPNKKLTYIMIETSPFHREEQKRRLSKFNNVQQYDSLREYKKDEAAFEGIVFSNELIDALPVNVLQKYNDNYYEIFVTVDEQNELVETKQICTNQALLDWLNIYGPTLTDGQKVEIPLAMNSWLEEVSQFLKRGFLLTIDYGYSKEEWSMPERKDGSLRGYYKHQLITDPLKFPTEMDLTSHIHLDAYRQLMDQFGLQRIADDVQYRFLLNIGLLKYLQENYDPNPFSEKSKLNRAVRSLISDTGMSAAFHVFLHGKHCKSPHSYSFLHEDPYELNMKH